MARRGRPGGARTGLVGLAGLVAAAVALAAAPARADRPTLSGPELRFEPPSGRFVIHYTLAGADAPTDLGDVDPANGVPDLLDDFALGLDDGWDAFVGADGWPPPPPDEGQGGDDRLDVYVRVIDAFGYTYYEPLAAGGDPRASHLELSNGLAGMGRVTVRSVAAHELHHALQAALTTRPEPWIFEATATWAQYHLFFDDWLLDIARDTLWTLRLKGAARPFDDTGARFDYAGMIWIKFLLERGDLPRRAVLDLWQALAAQGDWVAGHEAALAGFGLPSLGQAIEEFAEWNLFACHRADGHHYGAASPACGVEAEVVPLAVATLPAAGASVPVGPFGQAYLEFAHDCQAASLQVHVEGSGPFAARAVEVRAGGLTQSRRAESAGGGVDVEFPDWNNAARAVLILVNRDAQPATFAYQAAATGAYQAAVDFAAAQQVSVVDEAGAPLAAPLRLDVAQVRQLRARAFFGSCADGADATSAATWRTADERVASVSAGLVRAHGAGATEVVATVGEAASAAVPVTVAGGCSCRAGAAGGAGVAGLVGLVGLLRGGRARAGRRRPAPCIGGGHGGH